MTISLFRNPPDYTEDGSSKALRNIDLYLYIDQGRTKRWASPGRPPVRGAETSLG